MKTKYQYISFVQIASKTKTTVWKCVSNWGKGELGIIKWYPAWRQYSYFSTVQAVYSRGCLDDIGDFIRQLMDMRKASS